MKIAFKSATLSIALALSSPLIADPFLPSKIFVAGQIHNAGTYDMKSPPESLAHLLNRAGGLSATKKELQDYSDGSEISDLQIRVYRNFETIEFKVDPNSDKLWLFYVQAQDTVDIRRISKFKLGIFSMRLKIIQPKRQNKSEQATPRKPSD